MGDNADFKAFQAQEKARRRATTDRIQANTRARQAEWTTNLLSDLKPFPLFYLGGAVIAGLIGLLAGQPHLLVALIGGLPIGGLGWAFLRSSREGARLRYRLHKAKGQANPYSNPYPYGSSDWEAFNRTQGVD